MNPGSAIGLSIICLCMIHCNPDRMAGGAGAGNPPLAEVSLVIKARSTVLGKSSAVRPSALPGSGLIAKDSLGATLFLDSILTRVEGIDFTLPDSLDCSGFTELSCVQGEVAIKGPFTVDLLRGLAIPPLVNFRIPAGLYRKIGFEPISMGKDTLGIWDSTTQNIVVWGRLMDSASSPKRFVVRLNLMEGLDFENPGGARVKPDSLNNVLLGLRADGWFHGIDMRACVADPGTGADSAGVARLQGDGFCSGMGAKLRRNIEFSGGFDSFSGGFDSEDLNNKL